LEEVHKEKDDPKDGGIQGGSRATKHQRETAGRGKSPSLNPITSSSSATSHRHLGKEIKGVRRGRKKKEGGRRKTKWRRERREGRTRNENT